MNKIEEFFSKLTILIPMFNEEKTMGRTLQNILGKFNIIVVDDGSKDKTRDKLKELEEEYAMGNNPIFKVFFNEDNYGIAKTRNVLVEKVETKYFTFLDAGDILDINQLSKFINYFIQEKDENTEYDLLSFGLIETNEKEYLKKDKEENSNYKMDYIGLGENFFNKLVKNKKTFDIPCSYIYNTDFFKNNNFKYLEGRVHEDFGLTPFIILSAKNVYSKNLPAYIYIREESSITKGNDPEKLFKNVIDAYENGRRLENLVKELYTKNKIGKRTYKIFRSYLANVLIQKIDELDSKYKPEYLKLLNDMKIEDYYLNNIKGIIKKIQYKLKYKM